MIDDDPDAWRSPRLTLKKAGHKVIGTVRFDEVLSGEKVKAEDRPLSLAGRGAGRARRGAGDAG